MTPFLTFLSSILFIAAVTLTPELSSAEPDKNLTTTQKLRNDMTLISRETPGSDIVTLSVTFMTGSADESFNKSLLQLGNQAKHRRDGHAASRIVHCQMTRSGNYRWTNLPDRSQPFWSWHKYIHHLAMVATAGTGHRGHAVECYTSHPFSQSTIWRWWLPLI